MHVSFKLRSVIAVAILLLALGAGAAQAATGTRDQALNAKYGNAWTGMSASEFRAIVELFGPDVTTTMTPQEVRALIARGKQLNSLYGNAWTRLSPGEFRGLLLRGEALNQLYGTPSVATPTSGGDGFDWADAGIGLAAAFGAMLLAVAGAVAVRRRVKEAQPGF